jgi:fucose 4-O-acetylase-like acetyltransferase
MLKTPVLTVSPFERGGEKRPPLKGGTGRVLYIDLAKGICIFLVVLDHIAGNGYFDGGNYPMNDIFEQTRMPLYFILSGLFFKDYAGGIREFLLRKANRILIPYLFFMALYRVSAKAVWLLTGIGIGDVWAPLWFLLCLFWMNMVFATLYYIVKRLIPDGIKSEIILGLIVLGIGIAGYLAGDLPLNIGTALTSLPFLWMGFLLNRRLHFLQLGITRWWSLLTAIVLLAMLHFTYAGDNFFYLNIYNAPLFLIYLSGLLGTLGVLLLSRGIRWLPVISYIGRYSIIVLCTHMAVVKAVIAALCLLPIGWDDADIVPSLVVLTLTIVCSVLCCWLLSRYLPWFTAQKDLIKL